jgi:hypothetical protein
MRFVLLHHINWTGHTDHYDLMLEYGAKDKDKTLKCFATLHDVLPDGSNEGQAFTLLPDHRKLYLDYEGPVSNSRGRVVYVDKGDYETKDNVANIVQKIRIRFSGHLLNGEFELLRETDSLVRFRKST